MNVGMGHNPDAAKQMDTFVNLLVKMGLSENRIPSISSLIITLPLFSELVGQSEFPDPHVGAPNGGVSGYGARTHLPSSFSAGSILIGDGNWLMSGNKTICDPGCNFDSLIFPGFRSESKNNPISLLYTKYFCMGPRFHRVFHNFCGKDDSNFQPPVQKDSKRPL